MTFSPCPFCRSSNISIKFNMSKNGRFYYVQCQTCQAQTRAVFINEDDVSTEYPWDNEAAQIVKRLWNDRGYGE